MTRDEAYAVTDQDLAEAAGRAFLWLLVVVTSVVVVVRRAIGRDR